MGILDDAIREHLELKRQRGATDEELAKQEAEALGPARRQPAADPMADAGAGQYDEEVLPPPDLSTAAEDAPPPPPPDAIEPLEPLDLDPGDRLPPHGDVEPIEPIEPEPFEEPEPAALEQPLHSEPSVDDPVAPPAEPDFPATEVLASDDAASVAEPADPELEEPLPPVDEDATRISIDDATRVRPTRPIAPLDDDDSLPPEPALPDPEPEPEPEPEPPRAAEPPPPAQPAGDEEDVLEETPDFLQDTPDHDRLWFEQKPPRDFDFYD